MKFKNKIWLFSSSTLFIVLLSISAFYYVGWVRPLNINTQNATIEIKPNMGVYQLSRRLADRGWVVSPFVVRSVAAWTGNKQLRFGQYAVSNTMTVAQLLHNLNHSYDLISHQLTFIEGSTFNEFLSRLQANKNVTHTISSLKQSQLLKQLHIEQPALEGVFFPDTYHFAWGTKDTVILQKAHQKLKTLLAQQWRQRAAGLPYTTPYQALIVASLIQSEVRWPPERPLVASVIVNRLRKGMRLQIDTTVMYGLHKAFGSKLSRADLKKYTVYNTYRVKGLPPTPINMPGLASIHAALHPAQTPFLYYVVKNQGRHQFSVNYRQHLGAVDRYKQRLSRDAAHQRRQDLMLKSFILSDYATYLLLFFSFS